MSDQGGAIGTPPAENPAQTREQLEVMGSRKGQLFNKIRRLVTASSSFREEMVEIMELRQRQISDEIGCLLAAADSFREELADVADALLRQECGKHDGHQVDKPKDPEPRPERNTQIEPDWLEQTNFSRFMARQATRGAGEICRAATHARPSQTPKMNTNLDHATGTQMVSGSSRGSVTDPLHTDPLDEHYAAIDGQLSPDGDSCEPGKCGLCGFICCSLKNENL